MGVPAFFRWLSRKYPKIISQVVEDDPIEVDGVTFPCDYASPNPNGELDNLYLDMNGIVHPCTHPEGRPAPETEDEMMLEVFRYTDRVIAMARPRKVLMIAVDGVAPRAKMNQQRSRRFKAAKEAAEAAEAHNLEVAKAEARGEMIDDAIRDKKKWDSNVITPGTPFMHILAKSLRYWIAYKLKYDPGWKDLKVIISDATVPGEGEHKIMEFIRSQRSDPAHDPNTKHCIYGLDADLIFLGLATHEPHFRILREDVFAKENKKRSRPPALTAGEIERQKEEDALDRKQRTPFLWLHVDILREYLELELDVPRCAFPFDFERAIDDWVFMCFFVGNDFLPHMPSLDVRDNSIDMLTGIWKRTLARMGGYMTCDGSVDLKRVEILMQELGRQEDNIFRKRREQETRRNDFAKQRKLDRVQTQYNAYGAPPPPAVSKNYGEKAPVQPLDNMPLYTPKGESVGNVHMSNHELVANRTKITLANMANKTAAQLLKSQILNGEKTSESEEQKDSEADSSNTDSVVEDLSPAARKRKATEQLRREVEEEFEDAPDSVRLWEAGYRTRYYTSKFHISEDDVEFQREVVRKYIEGICWVLLYYYQGCASWTWYYPYHYAPFAQDLTDLATLEPTFDLGTPFLPYEQLMSVLPAASDHALPAVFRPLMSEPDSEIIDFYPVDFPIDMNGKKLAWLGIPLLPFIDAKRLLATVTAKYSELTEEEADRNRRLDEIVMISGKNSLYQSFKDVYSGSKELILNAADGIGLAGTITPADRYEPDKRLVVPIDVGDEASVYHDIEENDTLILKYHFPPKEHVHKGMLLNGVKFRDPPILTAEDRDQVLNMGQGQGRRFKDQRPRRNEDPSVNYYGDKDTYAFKMRRGGYTDFVVTPQAPNHGNGRYNNQGGYHGGHRGGYQGGHRGGYQGGYNQGGYSQGGYNQGGYNQGGYNQGGYNQGGYNQGGYNQGGYNQGGYNQGGYNQGGYNQGGYNQGGYNQGGYNQGGYNQGGYQGQRNGGGYPQPSRSGGYQQQPLNEFHNSRQNSGRR